MQYKEFLNANDNYNLVMLPEHAGDDERSGLIEVPDGAEQLTKCGLELVFWKDNGNFSWHTKNSTEWDDNIKHQLSTLNVYGIEHIVWQRYTQPESLPFVDDEVNHPSHYTAHPSGIECIQITRHHDFAIGNAIKYLWRAGLKNSDNEIQDLEKAIWYIQDKINQLKGL